jgi:catechol-2,3-dioxygenase
VKRIIISEKKLLNARVNITGMSDHTVSQSIYIEDPMVTK